MLSEHDEDILAELERGLGVGRGHRWRSPTLLIGVGLVFGGELLATTTGIALALLGFLGMVSASAAYIADARTRDRRRALRSTIVRILPFLRRW